MEEAVLLLKGLRGVSRDHENNRGLLWKAGPCGYPGITLPMVTPGTKRGGSFMESGGERVMNGRDLPSGSGDLGFKQTCLPWRGSIPSQSETRIPH